MENTFEMYKDAVKEHAYQSAMNNLLDDYVPLDEFTAEQEKVEVCHFKPTEALQSFHRGESRVELGVTFWFLLARALFPF